MPNAAERPLLFGLLALQNGFVTRDRLVAAFCAWTADKSRGLDAILVEQQALTARRAELLNALAEQHIDLHSGDVAQSLASLRTSPDARTAGEAPAAVAELSLVPDGDLRRSLAHVSMGGELQTVASPSPAPSTAGVRFVVLRPHAEGGLGQVSVALDTQLNREVAFKEIKARHGDDPGTRARFVREAEITGGLEHPGIVPVYALGMSPDGRPFYAMKFIRGDSLKAAIERFHAGFSGDSAATPRSVGGSDGRSGAAAVRRSQFDSLEFRQLLQRFVAVCQAMQYAHDRGVLHRDLKPANVMLGKYGETLVVDWGLAKAVGDAAAEPTSVIGEGPLIPRSSLSDSSGSETLPGEAIGTPSYMSPEQAAGRVDDLGPATDVYSLGATLHHLLTGRPSVERDADGNRLGVAEILQMVRTGTIPAPRDVQPAVPKALDGICRKAMSVDAASRYDSPRALAEDIEQWLADEPTSATPDGFVARVARMMRKHRAVVTSILAASVLLACGATIAALYIDDERRDIESERGRADRYLKMFLDMGIFGRDFARFDRRSDFEVRVRRANGPPVWAGPPVEPSPAATYKPFDFSIVAAKTCYINVFAATPDGDGLMRILPAPHERDARLAANTRRVLSLDLRPMFPATPNESPARPYLYLVARDVPWTMEPDVDDLRYSPRGRDDLIEAIRGFAEKDPDDRRAGDGHVAEVVILLDFVRSEGAVEHHVGPHLIGD